MSQTLVFTGTRRPDAAAAPDLMWLTMTLSDGTPLAPQPFVQLSTASEGTTWQPEVVDGSFRTVAGIDLSDPVACMQLVRRCGDPADTIAPERRAGGEDLGRAIEKLRAGFAPRAEPLTVERMMRPKPIPPDPRRITIDGRKSEPIPAVPVVTSMWLPLKLALQQAIVAWEPLNGSSISHFVPAHRSAAYRFLEHPAAAAALDQVRLVHDPNGGPPMWWAPKLASFLVASAALAIERGLPMTTCQVCGFWFAIRRPGRAPRFCTAACRAMQHRQKTDQQQPDD